MIDAVKEIAWWGWSLTILATYIYGVIAVAKYGVRSAVLDARKVEPGELWTKALLWPIAVITGEHEAKGLIYPTLWLWPRYRQEWPAVKQEVKRQEQLKTTVRVKNRSREFERKNLEITIADVKEDIKQEKTLEGLRAQLDDLNKLHSEGPLPIDAPERERKKAAELLEDTKKINEWDKKKGEWREMDDTTEWWYMTHRHYTTEWRANRDGCE